MNETNHPARRLRHGDRPTEPLTFEDDAANKAAEEGGLPNGGMHDSIFVKVWGDAGGGDAGRRALANYAFELGCASRQVANKAEVDLKEFEQACAVIRKYWTDGNWNEDSTTSTGEIENALTVLATPPATTGASTAFMPTVLTDERRDELARAVNLDGSMLAGKRCDYWRAYARAIEREVAAQAGQVAVPDILFDGLRDFLAPSPAKESK